MILTRFASYADRTLGIWQSQTVPGFTLYSIENPWLDNEPWVSCIPTGDYRVARTDSPKYGDNEWEIMEVPGRTDIRIHIANTAENVSGCIGLGTGLYGDLGGVASSRVGINTWHEFSKDWNGFPLQIKEGPLVLP